MLSLKYLLVIGSLLVFIQVVPLHAAPGRDDPVAPTSTPARFTKLADEDQKTFAATGRLSVVQAGQDIYIPGPIVYPCGQTWSSWWAANYWYFQCQANINCKPYIGCWCNKCACYLFLVNPKYPPCRKWIPWTPVDTLSAGVFSTE